MSEEKRQERGKRRYTIIYRNKGPGERREKRTEEGRRTGDRRKERRTERGGEERRTSRGGKG